MGRLRQEMDASDRHFGSGWISGMVGLVLAVLGLATVSVSLSATQAESRFGTKR